MRGEPGFFYLLLLACTREQKCERTIDYLTSVHTLIFRNHKYTGVRSTTASSRVTIYRVPFRFDATYEARCNAIIGGTWLRSKNLLIMSPTR